MSASLACWQWKASQLIRDYNLNGSGGDRTANACSLRYGKLSSYGVGDGFELLVQGVG